MSMLQLKHLFYKGVSAWYTQKNMGAHSKPVWRWLIQCNEGGTPFNFTIGRYQPEYMKKWPLSPEVFFYVYFFGYKWYTKNKKGLTGVGEG